MKTKGDDVHTGFCLNSVCPHKGICSPPLGIDTGDCGGDGVSSIEPIGSGSVTKVAVAPAAELVSDFCFGVDATE
jgi:hypothetical protein